MYDYVYDHSFLDKKPLAVDVSQYQAQCIARRTHYRTQLSGRFYRLLMLLGVFLSGTCVGHLWIGYFFSFF